MNKIFLKPLIAAFFFILAGSGCQQILAFNELALSAGKQLPQVTVVSPKNYSKHNFFPALSGTATDKSSPEGSGESNLPGGLAEVKVCILAEGKVWNGREWFRPQAAEEFFALTANLNGENWTISDNLPATPKRSERDPKAFITDYSISVEVKNIGGNKNYSTISISVVPLEVTVIDANRQFTGVDLSDGASISAADSAKLANLISFDNLNHANGVSFTDATAMMKSVNDKILNLYSRFRMFAVADGATKLLVIAKGYSPGSVSFASSPNTEFAAKCSVEPAITGVQTNQIPAVPGINSEQMAVAINKQIKKFSQLCTSGPITGDSFTPLDSYQRSENEFYWFSVYTVPPDVPPNTPNTVLGQAILLNAVYTPGTVNNSFRGQPQPAASAPLFLKRPPVLLVHGLNDNSGSWDLSNNTILQDAGFDVHLLDYRETNGASFEKNKLILLGTTIGVEDNPENDDEVLEVRNPGIKDILFEYRKNGIAISKVDVVGHSMGGILARIFNQQTENRSDDPEKFNYDNFNQGYIRRLITIGTPHFGSNISNILVNDFEKYGANGCGFIGFVAQDLSGGQVFTTVSEATVDLEIGSNALKSIKQTRVLSHAITSIETSKELRKIYYLRYGLVKSCVALNKLPLQGIQTDTPENFVKSICAGQPCDWAVARTSQQGGLVLRFTSPFEGINHGEEIGSPKIHRKVAELLLGGEENFARDGFPAVATQKEFFPPNSLCMFPVTTSCSERNSLKSTVAPKAEIRKPVAVISSKPMVKLPKAVDLSIQDAALIAKLSPEQRVQIEKMMRQQLNPDARRNEVSQIPNVEIPSKSASFRQFSGGNLFQIKVPENWRENTLSAVSVAFIPENGKDSNGEIICGLSIETTRERWQSPEQALQALIKSAIVKKPFLQAQSPTAGTISNQPAFFVTLTGKSSISGQNESIWFAGVLLKGGNLLYIAMFYPENERTQYLPIFDQALQSFQITSP